jgi:carboxymethylenebutenolidase
MVVAQATTSTTAAALFEAHMQAELNGDLDATMATMVEDPHLINLASGTGGQGAEGVREFYATQLIGQFRRGVHLDFTHGGWRAAGG